ncbi:MAG TPA: hypothetical protein GXZ60_02820 [Intrasporangiaceae bacterium]|nr:hypothetical protein [Intrasporangiaceae bacterium]
MTTIAPPVLRTEPVTRTPNRTTRARAAARRGAAALAGAMFLTVPAQLTLVNATTGSAVIAGATALGMAALLSFVVVGSIWTLTSAYQPLVGGLAAAGLGIGSAVQLYAVLALLPTGTSGVSGFVSTWAVALMVFGLHLMLLSATLLLRRSPGLLAAGVGIAGVAVTAAVLPPGWFPQTTDAVLALVAGQALLLGWLAVLGFRSPRPS